MKNLFKVLASFALLIVLVSCGDSLGEAPVLSGVSDKTVIRADENFDLLSGIEALDSEDGDITGSIEVTTDFTVYSNAGEYTVNISVTDSQGNIVTDSFIVTLETTEVQDLMLSDVSEIQLDVDNLELPSTGENGTQFYWYTDTPEVITKKGYVINPGLGSDPVTVTLTTKAINSSYSEYFDFEIIVQPNQPVDTVAFTQRLLEFEGTSEEYVVEDQEDVPIYYLNGGELPYIDIRTYIDLVDGALDSDIITCTPVGEDVLEIEYTVEWEDFDGSMVEETYKATIDFTANTFTVNNFSFFENYVAETSSDYGEGLTYVDALYGDGEEVTIPLGFYNFDIFVYNDGNEDQYLMPFHVVNLLISGGVYYDVYYNGDQLYGIDTFTISGGEEDDLALQELVRTSSYNDATLTDDVKFATYNFLGLTMDYFYGLRDTYEVDTYFEELSVEAESIIDAYSDTSLYSHVFSVAYATDDLHTSHVFTGYAEEPYDMTVYLNDLGPGTIDFYEGYWDMQDKVIAKYGSEEAMPEYAVIDDEGKTAVIYITGFTIDTPDEFKAAIEALPETVENVCIDLSYNTGGNVGAVLRIFGYMTEEQIMYHSMNPADGSTSTYYIESSYDAYDYEWYIITSSVTFSAANLMTAIAKEQGIATIIGQDSSGGASSIGAVYTPDGTCLLISTNNVLCTRVGNETDGYEYYSVEEGIEVDYDMYNPTSDSLILTTIAQAQADAQE